MTDNTELKRLAEAAPGGPWVAENDSLYFKDGGYTRHLLDADAGHDVEPEAYYAALQFIAAANPAAVLALIAENERLQGCEDVLRQLSSHVGAGGYNAPEVDPETFARKIMDGINILNDPLAQLVIKKGEQIDQLKSENNRLHSAANTLERIGYTDHGGELWKPPIGQKPNFDLIDQLRAEVAGLKTGYEAYERVNAELKAEVQALRKDAERYRHLRECNSGSLCITELTLDDGDQVLVEAEADQAIDAAMGKGEQS